MADSISVMLLITQAILHMAIAVRISIWNGHGYRYRPWISRFAWLLAGSSAASAVYILTNMPSLSAERINPWDTVFIAIVLAAVCKARGNLATLLTR